MISGEIGILLSVEKRGQELGQGRRFPIISPSMSHAVVPHILQSRLKKPSTRRWNINGSPLLKVRVTLYPCDVSSSKSNYSAVKVFGH